MAKLPPLRVRRSLAIPMRDGVRIALDVLVPGGGAAARVPTVLTMTRYWRSFRLWPREPRSGAFVGPRAPIADYLLARGYAVVIADGRGTGASDGHSPHPWSPEELADHREIVDWVVTQDWSNGRVGATGISYEGTTAMLLAGCGHPAVRAVAPRSFELDIYRDIVRPGGVLNEGFLRTWGEGAVALDQNRSPSFFGWMGKLFLRGVRPLDEDEDGQQLAELVSRRRNPPVFSALRSIEFRDDRYPEQGYTLDELSVASRLEELGAGGVPAQVWASWMDGTTADSALRLFAALDTVRELYIGAWNHPGERHASPFRERGAPNPTLRRQWELIVRFLEGPLHDRPPELPVARTLHYYVMGEERWRHTGVWPPAGTGSLTWYLTSDAGLAAATPATSGERRFRAHPRASTGRSNRWYTQLARPVRYGNRRRAAARLATWTSPPLAGDLLIVGHCRLKLAAAVEGARDAALFAYLELVEPDGRVRYVTEGGLRVSHRAVAGDPGHRREDSSPLVPGERLRLSLRLLPTAVRVPAGWRLRLGLAGFDAHTFERIPPTGRPRWTIGSGGADASALELPVLPSAAGPGEGDPVLDPGRNGR